MSDEILQKENMWGIIIKQEKIIIFMIRMVALEFALFLYNLNLADNSISSEILRNSP